MLLSITLTSFLIMPTSFPGFCERGFDLPGNRFIFPGFFVTTVVEIHSRSLLSIVGKINIVGKEKKSNGVSDLTF